MIFSKIKKKLWYNIEKYYLKGEILMQYTSRVQRRQQLQQQPKLDEQSVEKLIDLEITKEMPVNVAISVEQTASQSRQTLRNQKQINQLVEELHPLTAEEPIDDTNLEILRQINIIPPVASLEQDGEYEAAATKFSEATQQLQSLLGDLQKNRRQRKTEDTIPTEHKKEQSPTGERVMFDLEMAKTQELPVWPQLHTQGKQLTEATQALQTELQLEANQKPEVEEESSHKSEQLQPRQLQEVQQNQHEQTKELTFDYKKTEQMAIASPDKREEEREIAKQIARDRLINKILIATLVFLSIAVIITLGIGLSIIFLDQGGLS